MKIASLFGKWKYTPPLDVCDSSAIASMLARLYPCFEKMRSAASRMDSRRESARA